MNCLTYGHILDVNVCLCMHVSLYVHTCVYMCLFVCVCVFVCCVVMCDTPEILCASKYSMHPFL